MWYRLTSHCIVNMQVYSGKGTKNSHAGQVWEEVTSVLVLSWMWRVANFTLYPEDFYIMVICLTFYRNINSLFWCILVLLWLRAVLGELNSVKVTVQCYVYDTETGKNKFSGECLCVHCVLVICFIADPLISNRLHHLHWLTAKRWDRDRQHCLCMQLLYDKDKG